MPGRVFLIALSLLLFTGDCLLEAQVHLAGTAEQYAGKELVIYEYANPVLKIENPIDTLIFNNLGQYDLELNVFPTRPLYFNMGIYQCYFFAEPGKTYSFIFPVPKEKTEGEKKNPFFQPLSLHLIIEGEERDELNNLIRRFDIVYDPIFNKTAFNVYGDYGLEELDTAAQNLSNEFEETTNTYFNGYLLYRLKFLEYLSNRQRIANLSHRYIGNQPVLYDNPAWVELFRQEYFKVLDRFLEFGATDQMISLVERERDPRAILQLLSNSLEIDRSELLELILIKGLYDAFYEKTFSEQSILQLYASLEKISSTRNAAIIREVVASITQLLEGFPAPGIFVSDLSGEEWSLEMAGGKYIYLNFCIEGNYACTRDYRLLSQLNKRFSEVMEIVTMVVDGDREYLRELVKRNGYEWRFIVVDRESVLLDEYRILTYPTYYLVGRQGELIMSPAPAPSENIDRYLMEFLESK